MRLQTGTITAFLLGGASLLGAQNRPADFHWQKAIAANARVRIYNISGNVDVTPSTNGQVEVTGHRVGSGRYADEVHAEVHEVSDGLVICVLRDNDTDCDEDGVHGHGHNRWNDDDRADMDLQVHLPANVQVAASSVSGDVRVDGATGEVDAHSVSGRVRLEHVRNASSVSAHSVSGDVDAQIESLTGRGDLQFKTVSGSVTLELPKSLDADLSMSSVSGSLDSDYPITLRGGRMNRRHIEARIGNGGRNLDVSTVSGDVRLRAAKS